MCMWDYKIIVCCLFIMVVYFVTRERLMTCTCRCVLCVSISLILPPHTLLPSTLLHLHMLTLLLCLRTHTPHPSLHTPHSTPLTPHLSHHTPHFTPLTSHPSLHTPHSTPLTPHPSLHTPHFTPFTSHPSLLPKSWGNTSLISCHPHNVGRHIIVTWEALTTYLCK